MIKIALVVNLAKDPTKNREALAMLDYLKPRHPKVTFVRTLTESNALVELTCRQELPVRDAAAEVKRGLKINSCRIWHEQTIRSGDGRFLHKHGR